MSGRAGPKETLAWCFYRNPRHPYDGFMANYLFKPLKYALVRKQYDRLLAEFVRELPEVGHHFSTVHGAGGEVWLADTIKQMETTGVYNLYPLLERVRTHSQAQGFLSESGIGQPSLMEWLDYLKQWWFPYPATLRQLVEDDGDPLLHTALAKLKGAKIANSFTVLEAAAEASGRDDLASRTGISEGRLLDLVHRADVSRLPYTSGGAVKRLWKMGYRSLAALRLADPQDYAVRIEAYFAAGGKGTPFDARKATIQGFLQDALHAPEVVEAD